MARKPKPPRLSRRSGPPLAPLKPKPLTPEQEALLKESKVLRAEARRQRFIVEYPRDLNATKAAIRAGYPQSSAHVTGCLLLKRPNIRAAVQARIAAGIAKAGLTTEDIIEAIRRQVKGDIGTLFDEDGNHLPISALTEEDRKLIAGYEIILKNAAAGDGHIDTVLKVKLKPEHFYVELGAKYLGMLEERVTITNLAEIVDILNAGRARNAAAARARSEAEGKD